MANQIRLKRGSGSDPSASDLVTGELAVRTDSGKLFTKKDDNSVAEIGGSATVADGSITEAKIADEAVTLAKLEHGTVNNNGKFLRANNGADPTFETISQYSQQNVFSLFDQASTPVQRVLVGTEGMTIQGTSSAVSKLMFRDRTTANFLKFKPVDTLSAGVEFTLPSADGSANHVLKTDGSGVMSFGQIATASITDDAVTYAKIQNVSATNRILGRDSSGAGSIEEITPANLRTMLNVADGATNVTNNNQLTNGAGYITATLTNEQVQDIVGGMVSGNTESGITVTYQDGDGTLDFSVASQTDQNFTTTLKNKLDGIASGATNVTNNNQLTNGAGYITSADGGNAATLDSLDSTQFLRSDASDSMTGTLTIGDGSAQTELHIKKADNNVADHLQFYNGTTLVGEIGVRDTSWLRLNNQSTANIYTPRYIRADGGFFVDGITKGINGSGNFIGGTIAGASDYDTLLRSDAADTASSLLSLTTGLAFGANAKCSASLHTLSDGSTITVDFNTGIHQAVTLGGNRTLGDPSNTGTSVGQSGSIFITQDGTGSRTLSFHADYKFVGGSAPTLSTAANAVDRIDYVIKDTNVVHCAISLDVK